MTLVIAWRTTRLIEVGHRGVQAYRPMLLLLRFLTFFYVFFSKSKNVTFYVFLPCFIRFLELCIWHVHLVLDSSLIRSSDVNVFFEDDVAELVHYRQTTVDASFNSTQMTRFKSRIIERLQLGVDICLQSVDYSRGTTYSATPPTLTKLFTKIETGPESRRFVANMHQNAPIHTADADATQLSSWVASAVWTRPSAVVTQFTILQP